MMPDGEGAPGTSTCLVYGLGVESDMPLAGLASLRASIPVDVRMRLGAIPAHFALGSADWVGYYVSPEMEDNGRPSVCVHRLRDGSHLRLEYADDTIIVVDSGGSRVWATWPSHLSVEDTAAYLLGPTLGFVLRLRGTTCLHASAVAVDGRAVALVGPSGAGKSTTAAAFARQGYPVLTDDVLALTEAGCEILAHPAYPRVRLWPSSVRGLYGDSDALPCMTPNWEKRYLDLSAEGRPFQRHMLGLGAIYVLGERSAKGMRIELLGPREAVMALIANTYTSYLLDRAMRANEFNVLHRLVGKVPVLRVSPCEGFAGLPKLCALIAEDFRRRMTLEAA